MPSRRYAVLGALSAAAILAVGWMAYGFSLRLPFFWDDLLHFRWLEGASLPQAWHAPQVFSHYRPHSLRLWRVGPIGGRG
jgi:hypothetical protein